MPTEPTGAVRIRLRIGDEVATARLEDSAPAWGFAAMLPTTIRMHDLLGREKPGRLPRQLDIEGPGGSSTTRWERLPTGP